MARRLQRNNATILLDCWNGSAEERKAITQKLRSFGAERIEAWRFVTPENTCVAWYLEKEPLRRPAKDEKWEAFRREVAINSCRHDYRLYHKQLVELRQGFDLIRRINPLRQVLPLPDFP
jgi:hypothetical protein